MLNFNDCHKKLLKTYPDRVAKKCIEYGDNYIFLLAPKDDPSKMLTDSFFAVNRNDGTIAAYQPTNDKHADEFFKLWNKKKDPSFKGFKL